MSPHTRRTSSGIATLEELLQSIQTDGLSNYAERLDEMKSIAECFQEDPEQRLQPFVRFPGMLYVTALSWCILMHL